MIALEGNQRGDDNGRAGFERAGDLVDGRFAVPGRHHGQRILVVEQGGDRLKLPSAQLLDPERLTGGIADSGRGYARHGVSW